MKRVSRIALLIDHCNIVRSIRQVFGDDAHVDFTKLVEWAGTLGTVAFKGLYSAAGICDLRDIAQLKERLGLDETIVRPARPDAHGNPRMNADSEIGFVIGCLVAEKRIDTAVIVSGDGGFAVLAERTRGLVRTVIVGPDERSALDARTAPFRFYFLHRDLDVVKGVHTTSTLGSPAIRAANNRSVTHAA